MADVSVGKLLPNLKVTLGNDTTEVETSDEKNLNDSDKLKENSEENSDVKIVRSWMESLQNPKVYKNKSGGFTTGLDLISEENTELLSKRAERFGLEKEDSDIGQNIIALYESMGMTAEKRNSAKARNLRLDTVHMRGVNELNTNEIFHYFRDYGPASVEWINDFSCNVVWLDEATCARALLGVSKPLNSEESEAGTNSSKSTDQELSAEEQNENKEEEASMEVEVTVEEGDVSKIPVPPGHWRLGMPHTKAKSILLRFATKDDKKLPGAEKRSDFYKKYGNPNYGGLRGLISSSRKRKMLAESTRRAVEVGSNRSVTSEPEPLVQRSSQPRLPRMRMYADDEELKTKKMRLSRGPEKQSSSVHSRLGSKYTREDLCQLGGSREPDLRSKIRRIHAHRSPLCQ